MPEPAPKLPDYLQRLRDRADQMRAEKQPKSPAASAASDAKLVERARAYIAKMPPAISGQGGHNQTLCAARVLVHDFALPECDAWTLLNEFNAVCQPPWSEKELQHKLSEAQKLSQAGQCERALGNLLDSNAGERGVNLTNFIAGTKAKTGADAIANPARFGSSTKSLSELLDDPNLLRPPQRIATGFAALDAGLSGGMVQSGMYVLAGLTGRGKSTLCANLARNLAAAERDVLYFSLEDCDVEAVRKILAQQSQVAMGALERFHEDGAVTQAEYQRVQSALSHLRLLPLYLNASDCELSHIEQIVECGRPGAVLIDQSSWVSVPDADSAFTEASEISRRLKQLAKRMSIPVVALVQINRAGASAMREGQDLELFHIRDSGRWEQDADGVFIIQSVKDVSDGWSLMCLDVKKNRHGKSNLRIQLKARLACALVENSPEHRVPVEIGAQRKEDNSEDAWTTERFKTACYQEQPKALALILAKAKAAGLSASQAKELHALALDEGKVFEWPRKGNAPATFSTVPAPIEPLAEATQKRGPGRPKKAVNREDNSDELISEVNSSGDKDLSASGKIIQEREQNPPIPPTTAQ